MEQTEQKLPQLLRRSPHLNRIPNPDDFALDEVINVFFRDCPSFYDDSIGSGAEESLAKDTIYHPETNPEIIRNRQEVLQYFLDNPQVVEVIFNSQLKRFVGNYNREDQFKSLKERVKSYRDFVETLSCTLVNLPENQLRELGEQLEDEITDGRVKELSDLIADAEAPLRGSISTSFVP